MTFSFSFSVCLFVFFTLCHVLNIKNYWNMHLPKIPIFEIVVDTETDQFFFVFAFIYSHIHTRKTKKSSLLKCT